MLYFSINSTDRDIRSLAWPYGVTRHASTSHSFIFPEYILPSASCTSSLSFVEVALRTLTEARAELAWNVP